MGRAALKPEFAAQAVFWWDRSFCIPVQPVPSYLGCLERHIKEDGKALMFPPQPGFSCFWKWVLLSWSWNKAEDGMLVGHWECSCHCTSWQGGVGEGWGDRKMLLWELRVWWMRLCCGCLQYSPFHPPHTICSWQNSCDIKESLHFHRNAAALDYSAVINGRKIPSAF